MYSIHQDFLHISNVKTLDDALMQSTKLFQSGTFNDRITIEKSGSGIVATMPKSRVVGTFTAQSWIGPKLDRCMTVSEEKFDATDVIIGMSFDEVKALKDGDQSTDDIGQQCVQWDGPCEVTVVDAIAHFFSVPNIEDISQENFEFTCKWVQEMNVVNKHQEKFSLRIDIDGLLPENVSKEEFLKEIKKMIAEKIYHRQNSKLPSGTIIKTFNMAEV